MRVRRTHEPRVLAPFASIANITLLLLFFFMITAVHEVDRTRVSLPRAGNVEAAPRDSATVVLYRNRYGVLSYRYSDGKNMTTDVDGPRDIYYEATTRIARDRTAQFVLKADGDVPFERIDELLDHLRDAGVQKILLMAQPRVEASR